MRAEPKASAAAMPGKELFGHPLGLATLAGTELWERISFHGMIALLTLFMAEQRLLPGHIERIVGFAAYRQVLEKITGPLTVEALATQTFGLYIGLIYFTPVLGGLIGDRLLGRRNAVILGCVLMTLGHFSMAFDQSFLLALLLLILGAGFLRGNLLAQVGGLYKDGDVRSTHAMQIYYSMVNLGGFAAPLITSHHRRTWPELWMALRFRIRRYRRAGGSDHLSGRCPALTSVGTATDVCAGASAKQERTTQRSSTPHANASAYSLLGG